MSDEKIRILGENDGAQYIEKLIKGWVDVDGKFYGDAESSARYSSATHRRCECGELIPQLHYTYCEACRSELTKENWSKYPEAVWSEDVPVYCMLNHEYFNSYDELDNFCERHPDTRLCLVLCEPVAPPQIDTDIFEELCDDDGELPDIPDEVFQNIDILNHLIRKHMSKKAYQPGKRRIVLRKEDEC